MNAPTDPTAGSRRDAAVLGALALALLAWFAWPFLAHGHRFPLGPDAPVYLWWTRLAGEEGLSVVGGRAGAPALTLVVDGALGRSVVQAVAGLEIALGVALGLAAAALVRARRAPAGWALAALLAGTFAVHLSAGYLANLLEVVAFLAAAVALASATSRARWVAVGSLAAAGLAHPLFFLVGAGVLALTAALTWRRAPDEAARIGGVLLAGGAVAGAGLLALLAGPDPLAADTSRDAFLRRAGLAGELRGAYLDRFVGRWARYVQWASVPLAAFAIREDEGFVGRFLRAWAIATVLGVAVGLATGWFPPDRFVTFGFVVPILAALGLVRLARSLAGRPTLAAAVVTGLTLAMLAGAFIAWNRQEPFLSEDEVRAAAVAGATNAGQGTPLVFLVNEPGPGMSFLATRAANVIRASVPPDRIRDVLVLVPRTRGDVGDERRALQRISTRDVRDAEDAAGRPATVFVLRPFDELDTPGGAVVIDPALEADDPDAPLRPASPASIAASGVLALALLALAGYGWARLVTSDRVAAAAVAPALGAVALVLVAVGAERLGVPIGGGAGAWAVSALAGGCGYVAWRVLERRPAPGPSP
ncbi:MAG: hypothetical protein ACXWXP_07980 [Actinomycetota bacterium]